MQSNRADAPNTTTARHPACPLCSGNDDHPTPPPLAASAANKGPISFLMLRGRWLEEMGMGVGSTVRVEAIGTRITIDVVAHPTQKQEDVPTLLEREVHYTAVEPHTHHPHAPWSDR